MWSIRRWAAVTAPVLLAVLAGCSGERPQAEVDRVSVQAEAERPLGTEVTPPLSIPYDPALPIWVVVVEDFVMGASGVVSGSGGLVINPGEQIGPGVSAQLVSALQRVGNVAIIDYDLFRQDPQRVTNGLRDGERGPFLVKGTVTEFAETADVSGAGEIRGPNVGTALIPYVGPIFSLADGGKSSSSTTKMGMVGLDIRILDPTTGRLISSFITEGQFTSKSETRSKTSWGKTRFTTEAGASAIGQAQRQALNKAVGEIRQALIRQNASSVAQGP